MLKTKVTLFQFATLLNTARNITIKDRKNQSSRFFKDAFELWCACMNEKDLKNKLIYSTEQEEDTITITLKD